jgi:hypothetical protein
MDIREALIQEHSKAQMLKIVAYIGNDKKKFAELMTLMLTAEYRVAQRAAYPVSYCVKTHPALISPWFGKMIKKMGDKTAHDAIRRNALRILEDIDIPEKYCGELFEISNHYLHDIKEPIAVRAFSISVMYNIAQKYPDLKNEVKHNAESLLHCGIPALESRSRNILKQIKNFKT